MTRSSEMAVGLALAGVFAAGGLGLIWLGFRIHGARAELVADGVRTQGVIIGFERVGPGPEDQLRDKWLVPEVRFTTANGRDVRFLGSMSEPWWASYEAGGSVEVIYDPERPDDARIDRFAEIWFAPLMLWAVGAGAMLIPPLTMWRHARSGRS